MAYRHERLVRENGFHDFAREILRDQPSNIYDYGYHYFKAIEEVTIFNLPKRRFRNRHYREYRLTIKIKARPSPLPKIDSPPELTIKRSSPLKMPMSARPENNQLLLHKNKSLLNPLKKRNQLWSREKKSWRRRDQTLIVLPKHLKGKEKISCINQM